MSLSHSLTQIETGWWVSSPHRSGFCGYVVIVTFPTTLESITERAPPAGRQRFLLCLCFLLTKAPWVPHSLSNRVPPGLVQQRNSVERGGNHTEVPLLLLPLLLSSHSEGSVWGETPHLGDRLGRRTRTLTWRRRKPTSAVSISLFYSRFPPLLFPADDLEHHQQLCFWRDCIKSAAGTVFISFLFLATNVEQMPCLA